MSDAADSARRPRLAIIWAASVARHGSEQAIPQTRQRRGAPSGSETDTLKAP